MTCREKLKLDHPHYDKDMICDVVRYDCPEEHNYRIGPAVARCREFNDDCVRCWDSEVEEHKEKTKMIYAHTNMNIVSEEKPVIKDSGNRREFESGAVRDMQEGKGRCDLMPLEVVSHMMSEIYNPKPGNRDPILSNIGEFQHTGNTVHLFNALMHFRARAFNDSNETMLLEVAKHFEEGAKKYGESNWQKGIPPKCYIDSAIRHYLKWSRGDEDEPHDKAFVWNLMCCIWEVDYHSNAKEA